MGRDGIKPNQWKAIREYARAHDLIPQIGVPGMGVLSFRKRGEEKPFDIGMRTIQLWYEENNKKTVALA